MAITFRVAVVAREIKVREVTVSGGGCVVVVVVVVGMVP